MAQCYMCGEPSTSNEHVPPLVIFPESKDLPKGLDFRKNLITVPSCDDHNTAKSDDDEYLHWVIVSNIDAGPDAHRQWSSKVRRSYRRRPSKLRMFGKVIPVRYRGEETALYFVNKTRLDRQFNRIAHGLYYHEFQERWPHSFEIIMPSLLVTEGEHATEQNERIATLTAITARYLKDRPRQGDNQEVFHFRSSREEESSAYVLMMVFYGGFQVTALSIPSIGVPRAMPNNSLERTADAAANVGENGV